MSVFNLKYRDTRPVLEVTLLQPKEEETDPDVVYDLTGSQSVTLHIWLSDETKLTRPMIIDPDPETGKASYTWVDADWTELVVSPDLPLRPGVYEHRMEYEVLGPGGVGRLTFPNDGYDTLRIKVDIGQAS